MSNALMANWVKKNLCSSLIIFLYFKLKRMNEVTKKAALGKKKCKKYKTFCQIVLFCSKTATEFRYWYRLSAPPLIHKRTWTSLLYVVCTICACIIQRCKANLLNFCRSYDRGDFPMVLSHTSRGCKIVWKVGNCLYSCSKMHSKFSSEPFISPFLIP